MKFRRQSFGTHIKTEIQKAGLLEITENVGWTHQFGYWKQQLDAIFVKNNVPVKFHCRKLEIPGSDHFPVFADITV